MDGLSAAASVIAVIQISVQVFNLCNEYFLAVKDARKDIKLLSDEVSSLHDVLENIAEMADSPSAAKLSTLDLLTKPDGPMELCQTELEMLKAKLDTGHGESKMKRFGLRAWKWPFTSKDVKATLVIIGRQRDLLNLASTVDTMCLSLIEFLYVLSDSFRGLSLAIDQGVTRLRHDIAAARIDKDRDKIMSWISNTDPSTNYLAACKKRQLTTGEWFLTGASMDEWKTTKNSLLWLHGIPGCGKTILSSTIIEHMKQFCQKPGLAVIYFYFDFSDPEKQKASNFLSSLVGQLCSKVVNIPEQLKALHKGCGDGQQRPAVRELTSIFSSMTREFEDIFIVIDALDECPKNGDREDVLKMISEFKLWPSSNLHLLVTSRHELDIERVLSPLLTHPEIPIQGSQVESDINLYIAHEIATDSDLMKWPSDVKSEIEKVLTARANGMFRWAFCQLSELKKCLRVSAIRKTLRELPKTLEDTYTRILMNIDEIYQQEALTGLLWLAFSERPLLINKLAEAIVVDPQSDPPFDPEDRLRHPRDLLQVLTGLVTTSSKEGSEARSQQTIGLAHFSVKEYLLSDFIQNSAATKFHTTKITANGFIAECCLLYILQYDELHTYDLSYGELERYPLLKYACLFWYVHARSTPVESQKSIDPLISRLFFSKTALEIWARVHSSDEVNNGPFGDWAEMSCDSPLYYASDLGLDGIVGQLLKQEVDINAGFQFSVTGWGDTPLHRAALNGHGAIARLLLEHGADVHLGGEDVGMALFYAARNGHREVVGILLEHHAEVNVNYYGWTAMVEAARNGHEGVVQLLLEHGADDKGSALYSAIVGGHDEVVRLLLQHGADGKEKALLRAASGGHNEAVRLLLQHGADANTNNEDGETALHLAASEGYETAVLLLLEHGADTEARGKYGYTSLQRAASGGVVQLLPRHNADEKITNDRGTISLHNASTERWMGKADHAVIARLLLEYNADVNAQDDYGKTALHISADYGHETVAHQLLEHRADVKIKDKDGATALHRVAQYNMRGREGHTAVAQMLVEHQADVHAKDNDEQTALHKAAISGYDEVALILLEHKVDGNIKDKNGSTALQLAVEKGNDGIVELLKSWSF